MVAIFQGTIEKAAALAVFMPIVAGQGGNAGIQTITIIVRGIAVGRNRATGRPARARPGDNAIGLIKGVAIGAVVGLVAWITQDGWAWGLSWSSQCSSTCSSPVCGTLIPLGCAFRLDPALASGIFLTTFRHAWLPVFARPRHATDRPAHVGVSDLIGASSRLDCFSKNLVAGSRVS